MNQGAMQCTNHYPRETAPLAVVLVGRRRYCRPCAIAMLAFVERIKVRAVMERGEA